jgi:phosphate-selective porin OprO and OprP
MIAKTEVVTRSGSEPSITWVPRSSPHHHRGRFITALFVGMIAALPAWHAPGAESAAMVETPPPADGLVQRINELEQKLKSLEAQQQGDQAAAKAAVNQKNEDAAAQAALQQKLKTLETQLKADEDAAAKAAKAAPRMSLGSSGFSWSSADTNFVFAFHSVLQVDTHSFFQDGGIEGNDTFLLRKARLIFQGTVCRDFDFLFMPDFGGSSPVIQDAYLNYKYRPWLQIRGGKFKVPIGLEWLQSDPSTMLMERSLVTDLMPLRDMGFQLWGDVAGGCLTYAVGIFNGVGDGRSTSNTDFEDHKEGAARLFLQPFKKSKPEVLRGLGFGAGGSYGKVNSSATGLPGTTGGTLPGYPTEGLQQFYAYNPTNGAVVANGEHWRVSPQAYYYYGPFGLMGEYAISDQRVSRTVAPITSAYIRNTAWQVTGAWILTGEDASYGIVVPKNPFDPKTGKWGAVQLVGRYSELDVDDDVFQLYANPASSASAARAYTVGLNWYLNRNVRVCFNYSRTTFTGGGASTSTTAPAAITRQPEQAFFTRLQLAF